MKTFYTTIASVLLVIGILVYKVNASSPQLTVQSTDHVLGNRDASVVVYEFSDYECPYCQQHHATLQKLLEKYPQKIAWVYKHFPLSMHIHGKEKAEAAECVAEIGGNTAFWTFSDLLFASGTDTPLSELNSLAKKAGVDGSKFDSCVASGRHASTVTAQQKLGESLGIQGTPGNIIINSRTGEQKFVSGALPLDQFSALIEGFL